MTGWLSHKKGRVYMAMNVQFAARLLKKVRYTCRTAIKLRAIYFVARPESNKYAITEKCSYCHNIFMRSNKNVFGILRITLVGVVTKKKFT